jgi:hypothetical protein
MAAMHPQEGRLWEEIEEKDLREDHESGEAWLSGDPFKVETS